MPSGSWCTSRDTGKNSEKKSQKTKIAWPEKRTTENAIYENIFHVKAIL